MENNETYLKTDKSKLQSFDSGAMREDKTGKGRYDLIPGDIMSDLESFAWDSYFKNGWVKCSKTEVSKKAYFDDWKNEKMYFDFIVNIISHFYVPATAKSISSVSSGEIVYNISWDAFRKGLYIMRNELAKHYEAGAKVHGVDNWKKGLPIYGSERGGCFLDSMRRHADQALEEKTDEPHAIASVWNAVCAIWTLRHGKTSTIHQNESVIKADEPKSTHIDIPASSDITNNSNTNYTVTKWPDDFNPFNPTQNYQKLIEDAKKLSIDFVYGTKSFPKHSTDDHTHSLYSLIKPNLEKCVEALGCMVTDPHFSNLTPELRNCYFGIYSVCTLLNEMLFWFFENDEVLKCVKDIIDGVHHLINVNLPNIRACLRGIRLKWVPGSGPIYIGCIGKPDKNMICIIIETCANVGKDLLNNDHFRGRALSNGTLFRLNEHLKKLLNN